MITCGCVETLAIIYIYIKSLKYSMIKKKNFQEFGGPYYSICTICSVYLHYNPTKGLHAGNNCFHYYHDDYFFGLSRCDHKFCDKKKSDWASLSRSK